VGGSRRNQKEQQYPDGSSQAFVPYADFDPTRQGRKGRISPSEGRRENRRKIYIIYPDTHAKPGRQMDVIGIWFQILLPFKLNTYFYQSPGTSR
jgi:hypothetical protein